MQCNSISQFSISHQIADPINELETSKWIEAQQQKKSRFETGYDLYLIPVTIYVIANFPTFISSKG